MRVDVQEITTKICDREITQKQLAKGAGVSQTTVTAVLKRGNANVKTLGKLARYFECEPGELIRV